MINKNYMIDLCNQIFKDMGRYPTGKVTPLEDINGCLSIITLKITNKIISINQPYIFPYIGYFQLLQASDTFIIYDDVNFIKQGWVQRNRVAHKEEPILFTIPLSKPSQNNLINETLIHESYAHWKQKFQKSLTHCYGQTNSEVHNLVDSILISCKPGDSIDKLCRNALYQIKDYLQADWTIVDSSSVYNNSNLKGPDRIIDICQQEQATHYVNAIGGIELYNPENFKSKNINLQFIKKGCLSNNLSILDSLFRFQPCEIRAFLDDYQLIEADKCPE